MGCSNSVGMDAKVRFNGSPKLTDYQSKLTLGNPDLEKKKVGKMVQ